MKRILSLLMVICLLLGPLPSSAGSANTVTASDYESLRVALTTSPNGTVVQLSGSFSFSISITVTNSLILDLNGHSLTFTSTDPEQKTLICGIVFNGSGTFAVKDSGMAGKFITSETYSMAIGNNGSGILDLAGGSITASQEVSSAIMNVGSGTIKLTGARIASEKYYAVVNQQTSGHLYMSGGTVSSDIGFGLVNCGAAEISGGTLSSNTGHGAMNLGSGAVLTVSGGTVKSTSYYAISNSGNSNTVMMTGGTVSSDTSVAIANYTACEVKISGGTVSSLSGMAIVNMRGGHVLISDAATINASVDTAVFTQDAITMTGGTVHSDTGTALISTAPAGKDVNISGGTISSTSNYSVAHVGSGTMTISGNPVLSAGGIVSVLNQGNGTTVINGGTLKAGTAELYNSGSGKIVINVGTYRLAVNSNQSGSIIINGGSIKEVQGTTPRNNAGTGLALYGITLTNGSTPVSANTPVSVGELTLTPAVSYGFQGVKTDASGTIYLWLPAAIDTAKYVSGSIDVTGSISAGKTRVLPNFRANVTVKRNDETWDTPYQVQLSTRADIFWAGEMFTPDGSVKEGGIYSFSGLTPGLDYYIWGGGSIGGLQYSDEKVTNSTPNATVSYYDLRVTAGEGISSVFVNATLLQRTVIRLQADVKPDYTFAKWANTMDGAGGAPVLAQSNGSIMMNGRKDFTAYATLNTYEGTVTLNRNDTAWINSGKAVTLSNSSTVMDGAGSMTVSTDTDGVYRFTALSPLATHYIWVDGVYAGQTVTPGNKEVELEYYTVALTSGANITAVSGSGVYLKGTGITISATVLAGDHVFSRWQDTTGGALLSTNNTYAFPVNSAVSLTAVGAVTRYSATVTLEKDGSDWTTSPRAIALSTSETELVGTVAGTVTGNTYTFASLPGANHYYVWDADAVIYTNTQIDSSAKTVALDYYTLTVTPGSNVTGVNGAGTYLKGSNVTLTATPADYHHISSAGWVNGKYTVNNISDTQTFTPVATLDTYTGTVTLKKDGVVWTDSGKSITLSTSSSNDEGLALTGLDPTKTYYIWAAGEYTGRALSRASATVVVDYYTVSVTSPNVTVVGAGVYLAGRDVTLTATGVTAGNDFSGWYSGSALLSANMTLSISGLRSKQDLVAQALHDYTATVVVLNAAKSVTLKNGGTTISPDSGTTGTFSGLDRSVTYSVYANEADTGKTVSKSARSVTLLYYRVSLAAGPGVSSVVGSNIYLAGSNVTISAVLESAFTFNGWKGTQNYSDKDSTISSIDQNYTLIASAYKIYAGAPVDISAGSIVITDSANSGKIKVVQGGVTTDDIDPAKAFTITGTSTANNITINATRGATIIANNLDINISGVSAIGIASGTGDVALLLSGTNKLTTTGSTVAFSKYSTAALTIQSIDGTVNHSLTVTASGREGCAAIGGYQSNVSNITFNSGTVTAAGWGSGIGVWKGNTSNININGGIIAASFIGAEGSMPASLLSDFTVAGGTVNANWIGADAGGANRVIKGGSLNGSFINNLLPTDSSANTAYKVALDTGLQNTDMSGRLTITKEGDPGFTYGTKDMWTSNDANGTVYLYLSNGTYTATLGSFTKIIIVGDAHKADTLIAKYTIATPAAATTEGVTVSATPSPSTNIAAGATITVNVPLTGTALKSGTYTVGLTGTGIGPVATQTFSVTKGQSVSGSKTFTFTIPASDVTDLALTLSFSETAKYTVSYFNGSTLLGSSAYYEGEIYTLMNGSGLNKTGYTFGGWGVSGTQTMGTSDVIRTAVWTPNTYKVVFHHDSATTEQSFSYNAAATALNGSFTKTGYVLSGWAATLNGPKVLDINASVQNLTVQQNGVVDLYAVWQAQTYAFSFAGGGGTGAMATQSFTYGIAQELTPNAFARTGYAFTGWLDGATPYANGQAVTATGAVNLTAQWLVNNYHVVFNGNGANGGTPVASQSFAYGASQNLTFNSFTREGYSFTGWATSAGGVKAYDNGGSVLNLTAARNDTFTLFAVWTPNSYSVSFDKGAGTVTGSMNTQTHTYDTAKALAENAFTRNGYSFDRWDTEADGTGLTYTDKASVMNLVKTGSIALHAQWVPDTYTLAFQSSNGMGSMETQRFATGDSGTVSANRFTKPGYTFDGWNSKADGSGTHYAADAALMSLDNLSGASPTLYAQWVPNSYTVTYNGNGGTAVMPDQSFTYGVSQTLTSNGFTRGSDTFLGWSSSPAAESVTYPDGQSVSNLTTMAGGKVILYAVWKANTYQVRFDANGGGGDMLPQTIGRSTATSLNTNAFTRSGFSFSGWNNRIDGSGLSYANAQEVTNLAGDTAGSITLYAQWTENVRHTINGTVRESGGALLSGATVRLMQGSTIVAQTETDTDGRYFFGNIRSGSYNVVATKDGKTVTILVVVTSNMIQDMVIPAAASNNSVLVVTSEPNAVSPALTVGGLDDLASAENADITMTVVAKTADESDAEQLAIKGKMGSQAVGVFLDMTVKKNDEKQTSLPSVLEIVIPFSFSGKTDIRIYRYHGGQTTAFTKLTEKPVAPFVDGTVHLDTANGLIYVYASRFSTYAVTYTGTSEGGSGGNGGNGSVAAGIQYANPVMIDTAGLTGGAVKADKKTAIAGDKVILTVTPEKGYRLSGLTIADASGKDILYTDNGDGTLTFVMPATAVTVRLVFGRADGIFPFVDVPESHWARTAIAWAYENKLFSGTSETMFGPGVSTSRGMVVTVLWRMEKQPSEKQDAAFKDVAANAYYAMAVAWAKENEVVLGYGDGRFGPGDTISREQLAAILFRYAQRKGVDVSKRVKIDRFADGGRTSGYALPAMEWAVANNFLSGKGNGILDPVGKASRAEIAAVLMRFAALNR